MPAQLTPLIFKAFKDSVPGVDANMAGQIWGNMVKADPSLVDADETDVAMKIVQATKTTAKPQPVPEVKTQLRSPYAGTAMEARNPQNPQAELVGQFDPEQVRAAYADLQKRYESAAPGRNAAIAMGAAGGPGVISAADTWKDLDAYNAAMTTGKQTALEKAATSGLAAGTTAQAQDQTAGTYTLEKLKGIEDLAQKRQTTQTGALDLEMKQSMFKPGSPMANIAMLSAIQQWKASNNGQEPPAEVLAQFKAMSAEQLSKFATPKFVEAWKEISAGRTGESKADVDVAVAGSMVNKPSGAAALTAPAQPTPRAPYGVISKATQDEADRESLRIINSEYAKERDPATKASLMREMLRIKKKLNDQTPVESAPTATAPTLTQEGAARLARSPISGAGQTLLPDPRIAIAEQGEGQAGVDAEKRARTYDTQVAPALKSLRAKINETGSGKGTAFLAAWAPGESRELLNLLQNANNMYPGMLPENVASEVAKSQAQGGFTGNLVASLDNGQLQRVIDAMEQKAAADRNYQVNLNKSRGTGAPGQFGVNQPVTSSKTVEMTKGGVTYDIPADKVKSAEAKGYKVK